MTDAPLFTPEDVAFLRAIAKEVRFDPKWLPSTFDQLAHISNAMQYWLDHQHDAAAGRPLMVLNDATGLWDRARQQDLDVGKMPVEIPYSGGGPEPAHPANNT